MTQDPQTPLKNNIGSKVEVLFKNLLHFFKALIALEIAVFLVVIAVTAYGFIDDLTKIDSNTEILGLNKDCIIIIKNGDPEKRCQH